MKQDLIASRYTVLLNTLLSELITCWQRPQPEKLLLESAFLITQKHCDKLKQHCCQHRFNCDNEEIYFFKTIHPQFAGRMMYYSIVYESILSCPPSSESAKTFWSKELGRYDRFVERYPAIVEYVDHDRCDNDDKYFLRRSADRITCVQEKAPFMCSAETTPWSTTTAMYFAEKSYFQYVLSKMALQALTPPRF